MGRVTACLRPLVLNFVNPLRERLQELRQFFSVAIITAFIPGKFHKKKRRENVRSDLLIYLM